MKALLWLLLFAFCGWADEAADRTAIARSIAALNELPQRPGLFTADSDAPAALEELRRGERVAYRPLPSSAHPTVTISHEPWGEATINFPKTGMEILNPKIVSFTIRLITTDVALVDGACTYTDGIDFQTSPLLFVMKKSGDDWTVASLRVLR